MSEAASFKGRVPTTGSSVKEFHSSLGNILMSYGIVGLGLLFAFFFVVFRNTPTINLLYFGLIMLYGVTHMGMRDTMLWIFLGLVYGKAWLRTRRRTRTSRQCAELRSQAEAPDDVLRFAH